MKILLTEYEPEILEFFNEYLSDNGYDVIAVDDGQKALDAIEKNSQIDALVTDANLPLIKGPAIAVAFHKKFPQAPICVISGHLDAENLFQTEAKDIKVTIKEKPFTVTEIKEWLISNGIK